MSVSMDIHMDGHDKIIVTRVDGNVINLIVNDEDIFNINKEK
jgi:hypothetical protein